MSHRFCNFNVTLSFAPFCISCFVNIGMLSMRGDRTFIGTPGSGVFKLGISGLTLSGSGNSFLEFRDVGI